MFEGEIKQLARVNRILKNETYIKYILDIEELEADREFCRHNMFHFVSVARIATIINYRSQLGVDEELIYAAALLHDIGRAEEYRSGKRHELVSCELAGNIIDEAGFMTDEKEMILSAINNHRDMSESEKRPLDKIIYMADKLSRECFCCKASDNCHKPDYKKNMELNI